MNPAELRDQCLWFPGAEETFPFGPKTSVFKVAGKMFALSQLGADSLRVSLKCEPQLAEALRGAHAAVLPGYHLSKRHWNTVTIDGSLPDDATGSAHFGHPRLRRVRDADLRQGRRDPPPLSAVVRQRKS
jgi:predicted DNA-binding protein (MmcQ/YjbR family)